MEKTLFSSVTAAACILFMLNGTKLNAQQKHNTMFCGSDAAWEMQKQKDPGFEQRMKAFDESIQEYLKKNPFPKTQTIVTIPVVFHVVYRTSGENLSDACVQTCLAALNRDFRKQNSDLSTAPSQFQAIAADCEFNFCLATKDPQGNPTTGIIHVQTSVNQFTTNDAIKYTSQGGDDSWGATNYLNIWIGNLGTSLGGYAYFPCSVSSAIDGVVINYMTTGQGSCAAYGYQKGRTCVHEVGHWLGLYHTFQSGCAGTSASNCASAGDMICDTPPTASANINNYSCTQQNTCTETPTNEIDQIQNYMDYTDDDCRVLFTAGQKARMVSAYNQCRTSVGNGAPTYCSTAALDAGIASIVSPNGTACNTTFSPVVKLQNFGANTLTSCTINYKIDNNPNQTYNWTGSLASGQFINVTLPSMTTTAGAHTFTSFTSNPNGSSDGNTSNDQATSSFNVSAAAQPLPFLEGIENATFPPVNWALNNPDGGITWSRTTAAAKTGSASMYVNNYNYSSNGQVDEMVSPPLNLSSIANPALTFQVAYQMYSNPSSYLSSDTLKVLISTDCGVTWTQLYNKYHVALITATPQYSTNEFFPTSAQWRMESISLTFYSSATNALIKFRHTTDYENNLYVDDINITGVTGMNEYDLDDFISIYPNPTNGQFTIQCPMSNVRTVEVYNVFGEKIIEVLSDRVVELNPSTQPFNYSTIDISSLPNGMYFVKVSDGNYSITKKLNKQ